MTRSEEIYLISKLIENAVPDGSVDLNDRSIWAQLFLNEKTRISEDYFYELNEEKIIEYEEVGEDGFAPIRICSIKPETGEYYKQLLIGADQHSNKCIEEIKSLNDRIKDILTFSPQKLSGDIKATENAILKTKQMLNSDPALHSLLPHLSQIETHVKSISRVADNYEDIYKNIILPVKEEGRSGVRKTVIWAIIGIIASTVLPMFINWLQKSTQ